MFSKFKSLSALVEILAWGQFWGINPNFGGNFSFGGGSIRGNYPSIKYVFLDFLLFLFYIVNFYLFIYF